MKALLFPLAMGAALLAVGCAPFPPYQPKTDPEKIEFGKNSLDVYPGDVRQDPAKYDKAPVAWAGIIRQSEAKELADGRIRIQATVEHHYFDWQRNTASGAKYSLSPRGEGMFKTEIIVEKVNPDATAKDAEAYAAPGKLAIVYGTPAGVDDQGVVQLKYRYMRVFDKDKYTTAEFDYGRFGEPVVYLK